MRLLAATLVFAVLAAGGRPAAAQDCFVQSKEDPKKQEAKKDEGKKDEGETEESEQERKKREKEELKKELKLREAKVKELMRTCEKARPDQKWAVLSEIGKIPHPSAVAYLSRMLNYRMQSPMMMGQVRMAAADGMKGQRDPRQPSLAPTATKKLMAALEDRWNRREKEGNDVMRNCLKSIGELRDPGSKKLLLKMITNGNTYWAEESIRALEKLRDASTIEKIINEWLRSDNEGKKTSANDNDKERRQVIGEASGAVLAALTGQTFEQPLQWQKWWAKVKKTFRIKPLPEDPPAGSSGEKQ